MPKKLVIDVDTGTDDAQAIMLALSQPDVDVIAITCVHGNVDVENVCRNTLRVLKVCNRLDIPVYKGAECSLLGKTSSSRLYHGTDGLGDCPDPEAPPISMIQEEHAVSALSRLSKQYPGEITLVALAPLTNVALTLRMDPHFGERLKQVVIMGGNMSAHGNIAPCQEYNFHCDPEAAYVSIKDLRCPIIILPLEPTVTYGALDYDFYDNEIVPLATPKAKFHHSIITITDARRRSHVKTCAVCDVNALSLILDDKMITKSSMVFCTVELTGSITRGQLVVDWKQHFDNEVNVQLVIEYDLELFKVLYKNMFI